MDRVVRVGDGQLLGGSDRIVGRPHWPPQVAPARVPRRKVVILVGVAVDGSRRLVALTAGEQLDLLKSVVLLDQAVPLPVHNLVPVRGRVFVADAAEERRRVSVLGSRHHSW